ncbi:contactin-associated protein like 5-3-like [Montipora capricornis]|uniref:contactin-associated protein like 5-3-like n=1 Tax=Montipora capricornis TaxID=246305 RepID=UPI0035F18585
MLLTAMKPVVFALLLVAFSARIAKAWLQSNPGKKQHNSMAFGSFQPYYYHSLTATKIVTSKAEDELSCAFTCIGEPKCFSFNFAAYPDSQGLYPCELLDNDMFQAKANILSNASFHHFSPPQSPCHNHSCQNESECVPDFEENSYRCKCHPGFVGLHCERKGKSCSEIKSHNPEATSGSYAIDPDGEGGCEPLDVFCNMSENNGIGVTVIGHDSENRTLVNGLENRGSYRKTIQYSGVSSSCFSQLFNLTRESSHCEQFIKYECYHSVLLYNGAPYGWWESHDHGKMNYWGGAGPVDSYKCACGVAQQCASPANGCNCDTNDNVWREDSGFLTQKSQLPVVELRFGDTGDSIEKGYHTLGKLRCYGMV